MPNDKDRTILFVCSLCGSMNVQCLDWVDANTNEVIGGGDGMSSFCEDCETDGRLTDVMVPHELAIDAIFERKGSLGLDVVGALLGHDSGSKARDKVKAIAREALKITALPGHEGCYNGGMQCSETECLMIGPGGVPLAFKWAEPEAELDDHETQGEED